jgi:hypothetical protein
MRLCLRMLVVLALAGSLCSALWAQSMTEFSPAKCLAAFCDSCVSGVVASTCVSGYSCAAYSSGGSDFFQTCVDQTDGPFPPYCWITGAAYDVDCSEGTVYLCAQCVGAGNWTCNTHGNACNCGVGNSEDGTLTVAYPCST